MMLDGYVLEKPRVGAANSPFTYTPDNLISDQSAFDAAYPSSTPGLRTDYLVLVLKDGKLHEARFGWTKNEQGLRRFDYFGREQRFKPLPGGKPESIGTLALDSNVNRFIVPKPVTTTPVRISLGNGVGFETSIVSSANPSPGQVHILDDTGEVVWNDDDITAYEGEEVFYQGQTLFAYDASSGFVGNVGETIHLNPIPGSAQKPLLRIGFSTWLDTTEVANDAALGSYMPAPKEVAWSRTTGKIKFNPSDESAYAGKAVYYDGILFATDLAIQSQNLGTVDGTTGTTPSTVTIREGADLFFRIGDYQFPETQLVETFSPEGKVGAVQVRLSDGAVLFSQTDRARFAGQAVMAYMGDVDIERGITFRFFRTPVDPGATQDVKDVSAFYAAENAIWADPIIGSPQVHLPAIPVEDAPIHLHVEQGTGRFTGTLPRLDVDNPPTSDRGFVLDAESRTMRFASRKPMRSIPLLSEAESLTLPDGLVLQGNFDFRLDSIPQVVGSDILVDYDSGVVRFVRQDTEILADRFFQKVVLADPRMKVERIYQGSTRELQLGVDYRLTAQLGFIEFTERLLEGEEVRVTYPTTDGEIVVERAVFLVRKEQTPSRTQRTSVVTFNPTGREVATNPPPTVFRGGRPQVLGQQCKVDYAASTITFLPDLAPTTNAWPHGENVEPSERIYVDYYVYQAMGGEKNVTVLRPPIAVALVALQEGANSFRIRGDWTAIFPANHLLRVNTDEVYLLGSPIYDASVGETTVTLAGSQTFRSDQVTPELFVSTGPVDSGYLVHGYTYEPVARGMNRLVLSGDQTTGFTTGSVVVWTGTSVDWNLVTGSSYDAEQDKTTVNLASNGVRQYTPSTWTLGRTIRPIFEVGTTKFQTSRVPVLENGHVLKTVKGATETVLQENTDYRIDGSGHISLVSPFPTDEALVLEYTGHRTVVGHTAQFTYTNIIAPNDANGLSGQILQADFTTFLPDSFYFRVEAITNFMGELAQQYRNEVTSSAPSAGPILSAQSQPKLHEQGRPSVFFPEGRLSNEDIVARATLLFYHEAVEYLEDALQVMDGRVVGDSDGRFRFDGKVDNPIRMDWASVTNEIDDLIKVSEAPYKVTFSFPSFNVELPSIPPYGTYVQSYTPSAWSRFYPTSKGVFGVTASGSNTGDAIFGTGERNLTSVTNVHTRLAWALVVEDAPIGATSLKVDMAQGSEELVRPAFGFGQRIAIQAQDGSFIIPDDGGTEVKVVSTTATTITLDTPLSSPVPAGSTVRRAYTDVAYYQPGKDFGLDAIGGAFLYVKPYPPFDGSNPLVPEPLEIHPIPGGTPLRADIQFHNALTEPKKVPALFGETLNDDGDRSFPILNPSLDSEMTGQGIPLGHLRNESTYLVETQNSTTPPYVSDTGTMLSTTVIHDPNGFGPIAPKVYDLVRILTGAHGPSTFRRITGVDLVNNELTIDTPFSSVDAGPFEYVVTVSDSLVSMGTGNITPNESLLQDITVDFRAVGVKPGHTVVIESAGANQGLRRQVTSVATNALSVSPPFQATGPVQYRVDDSLCTFGTPSGDRAALDFLAQATESELRVLHTQARSSNPYRPWNLRESLEKFLDMFLTTVASGSDGQTSGSTFTGTGFDDVTEADALYIQGVEDDAERGLLGLYQIKQPITPGSFEIDGTFPFASTGVTYRVVSYSGISFESLREIVRILEDTRVFIEKTETFLPLIAEPIEQPTDSGAFTRGVLPQHLMERLAGVAARELAVSDYIESIENILGSVERLYEKRYVWIDTRINLERGILSRRSRAIAERVKLQAEILNNLTKLLAIT